jgi:hypothetical protein
MGLSVAWKNHVLTENMPEEIICEKKNYRKQSDFMSWPGPHALPLEADVAVIYNRQHSTNVDGLHFMTQRFAEQEAASREGIRDPKENPSRRSTKP